jgi:hypothetical protein
MAAILPNDFDAQKVTFSTLRTLDNGGKVVYVSYDGAPLIFQTPEMIAPFGVSKWDNDKGSNAPPKFTLDLSFKGMDSRDVLKKFYDNLCAMDTKILNGAKENSMTWFKKEQSEIVLRELMTKIIREPKDQKYPATFKVTLPKKDGSFDFEVYNQDKQSVSLDSLELKGARVTALIQCLGVWIAGAKFGISWKVVQMKVSPLKKLQGYSFKDVDDKVVADADDDDDEPDANEVMEHAVAKSDDEDDVDESDDELEAKKPVVPTPAPPVTAAKTTVRKTAAKK